MSPWTAGGLNAIVRPLRTGSALETLLPQILHLVARPDFWHAGLDAALRRVRRRRRFRQQVLSWARQGQDHRDRAALGDLQRLGRALEGAARLAWLATQHGRHTAERRRLPAAGVAEAISP